MNRSQRAKLGKQTVEIVQRGWYEIDSGQRIDISHLVADCLAETQRFTADALEQMVPRSTAGMQDTQFTVTNETSLSAARRTVVEQNNPKTLCLNFASAKNPGGGFLGGSQAQEESLARSSALYASLTSQETFYEVNRKCGTAFYTDQMILSPNVPVIHDDDGNLLPEPYLLSIVTAPAVNSGAIRNNEPAKQDMIRPTMASRVAKLFALAAGHGYDHLILGAWGCGVFRNDPNVIADLFAEALLPNSPFVNHFQGVTFAVLDSTADERIVATFRNRFQN